MAHLTNFSFEFFYKIFTEDASQPLLYHGAKKSKLTKNSNQGGGPALRPALCGHAQPAWPTSSRGASGACLPETFSKKEAKPCGFTEYGGKDGINQNGLALKSLR